MQAHPKAFLVFVAVLFLVVTGCGKKIPATTSITDSPGYHYSNGLRHLDNDQIDDAIKSFERAVALDPGSPHGYIGRGLVFGRKGEFKSAFGSMSKGKGLDTGVEAHIGMIRLYSMQRKKDWLSDAESEFKTANDKVDESARLHYFMGVAYKYALEFEMAEEQFKTVLDMNRELTGEANDELVLIQKIQRAAPVTEIARKISLIATIDRADSAALFDHEMNIEQLLAKRGIKTSDAEFNALTDASAVIPAEQVVTMDSASDITSHWLKPSINRVLKLQIRGLEVGQDLTFDPDRLITRAEFALMLEDILIKVSGDEKLATKFLGATSPFTDVRNDQHFFNAAMTAASRGFIEADKASGEFTPGGPVSGVDALLSIRAFNGQLKSE